MMKTNSGFTLVELLIVLAIAAIMVSLAVPAFGRLIADNRMILRVNGFVGLTNYARGEAVKRSDRVSLCPSADGTNCLASGSWESGWIVFVDADASGTHSVGDTLLQVQAGLQGVDVTVRGSANVRDYLSYTASGLIRKVDGSLQSGFLVFCDHRGAGTEARTVTVDAIGRLTVSTGAMTCTP